MPNATCTTFHGRPGWVSLVIVTLLHVLHTLLFPKGYLSSGSGLVFIFSVSIRKAFSALESHGPYHLSVDSEKLVILSFYLWELIYSHLTLHTFP